MNSHPRISRRNPVFIVTATLLLAIGSQATASELQGDLEQIYSWWHGDYDNDQQIKQLVAEGQPVWRADGTGEGGHVAITSHYRRVVLPAFGDYVIYVEETKHNDPNDLFRQRIYTLTADENEDLVRVKLWNFKDKTRYVGAWLDLSRLDGLSLDEVSPLPDKCDLVGRRQGEKFFLPMRDRDCAFGDQYFNYQVMLGADSFWFRDKIVDLETDEVLETAGGFTWHQLEKSE